MLRSRLLVIVSLMSVIVNTYHAYLLFLYHFKHQHCLQAMSLLLMFADDQINDFASFRSGYLATHILAKRLAHPRTLFFSRTDNK